MEKDVIHKADYRRSYAAYVDGVQRTLPSPACTGPEPIYFGEKQVMHRQWSKVTCMECLDMKGSK